MLSRDDLPGKVNVLSRQLIEIPGREPNSPESSTNLVTLSHPISIFISTKRAFHGDIDNTYALAGLEVNLYRETSVD
jgi:hypothetical protein